MDGQDGRINEVSFAEMLLMHSQLSDKKQQRMLKRVKKFVKQNPEKCEGITFDDVLKFFGFLAHIGDVDTACKEEGYFLFQFFKMLNCFFKVTFYNMAGASVDQPTLQHVAKTVANVDIRTHVIETVFTLFDENRKYHC